VDILTDIAHYAYDRYHVALEQEDASSATHLQRSIELGTRAATGDDPNGEALYYLGLAHEQSGNLPLATRALLDFVAFHRSNSSVNLALARMLVQQGQNEIARLLIARVYSASHSEKMRAMLRDAELRIDDVEFVVQTIDELL
jgi:Flp pilus assembly protein TadD